jgi:hypothetical protein
VFSQAFRFSEETEGEGIRHDQRLYKCLRYPGAGGNFTDDLLEMITGMQILPDNIGIEITESVFSVDYQGINRVLGTLRDSGLHVAIDDFGTGTPPLRENGS